MTVENPNAIDMVTERDGGRLTGACEQAYPSAAGGVDFLISCLDDPVGDADRLVVSLRNTLVSQFGIGLFFLSSFPGQ